VLRRRPLRVLVALGGVVLATYVAYRVIPVNATTVGFAYLLLIHDRRSTELGSVRRLVIHLPASFSVLPRGALETQSHSLSLESSDRTKGLARHLLEIRIHYRMLTIVNVCVNIMI
jgi:hypothetical protein